MHIVRLTGDDWQWEREMRLAALCEASWAFGSTLDQALAMTEADWRYRIVFQHRLLAVAEDGTGLGMAGWLRAEAPYPPCALLIGMWVEPSARGTGAGDALVQTVIADCAAAGEPGLYLQVGTGNTPARRLYTRNGFVPVLPKDDPLPRVDNEMTMHREIPAATSPWRDGAADDG